MEIPIRHDSAWGCGYRKQGGLYLVSERVGRPCGLLPVPLHVCPTCSTGIKPARGWTWINAEPFLRGRDCAGGGCAACPLASQRFDHVGLLWIGGEFYKTAESFIEEADRLGVSRRIAAVPKGFQVGETWVFLAHRHVIPGPGGMKAPGIFRAFQPVAVEYVVKGTETDEELQRLSDRGITPVEVEIEEDPGLLRGAEERPCPN